MAKNRSGLTQSFDGYVCNGEEGLVIPKSNMLSNGNNMKLPIESSSQFVRTNPKPSIESYQAYTHEICPNIES
jgi:hypothetical protein